MAGGSWTTKHVVIDLPSEQRDAYAQFFRSPCMLVNVALRNWRFLYKRGISGAFWYGGLGIYGSVRKSPTFSTKDKTIGPDSPVVMTIKVLFCRPGLPLQEQQNAGRAELLSTSFRDYERRVREQLTEMFAIFGIRRQAGYRRHRSQPLGTRLLQPAARLLLWQGWATGAARDPAPGALRAHCFRQYRSFRRSRPSHRDRRRPARRQPAA